MTEIKIRQSRPRGRGAFLGITIVVVILLARWGPQIGRMQGRMEREREEKDRTARILQNTSKDLHNLRNVLEKGNTVEKFLKSLPKSPPNEGDVAETN